MQVFDERFPAQPIPMRLKIRFRIGLILVSGIAMFLFYLNERLSSDQRSRLSDVKTDDLAFRESLIPNVDKAPKQRLEDESDTEDGLQKGHEAYMVIDGDDRKKKIKAEEDEFRIRKEMEKVKAAGEEKPVVNGAERKTDEMPGLQPIYRRSGKMVIYALQRIHVSVVICGDRAAESLVMFKSAVVLTSSLLVLHIFAEAELHAYLTEQMLLTNIDAVIYVDTDVVFVSPLEHLWDFFSRFNAAQLAALAPEHEDPNEGWYNRFARHPFVRPLGVNSGVMLMNLTRLRQSVWLPSMLTYHKEYRLQIPWGDQDLINIYFHFHPDQLYLYSCAWNFRQDHCMYRNLCKPADEQGAFFLHESRRTMQSDEHPAFVAVYKAFRDYHFGEDVKLALVGKMRKNLEKTRATPCGKVAHIFLKQMELFVKYQ